MHSNGLRRGTAILLHITEDDEEGHVETCSNTSGTKSRKHSANEQSLEPSVNLQALNQPRTWSSSSRSLTIDPNLASRHKANISVGKPARPVVFSNNLDEVCKINGTRHGSLQFNRLCLHPVSEFADTPAGGKGDHLKLAPRKVKSTQDIQGMYDSQGHRKSIGRWVSPTGSRNDSVSSGSRKNSLTSNQRVYIDKEKCVRKFHLWIVIVRKLVGMELEARKKMFPGTVYREQLEYIDRMIVKVQETIVHYADFRPDEYKANRQMRMSSEAKRILQKPPKERTDKEVQYATIALRGIKDIAEYPVRMQKQLAKYGLFESFESKRLLLKQGDPPTAFYFILFGKVIVSVQTDDIQDAKTVVMLDRGETFGELAIMSRLPRQSSVITMDHVELLSIDVHTYQRLFMVGGEKNINDPDQNAFMRSLIFLNGWPMEHLKNREFVRFYYTKSKDVIIHDSNWYDWLVIVKTGSLQVLKKLHRTHSRVKPHNGLPLPKTTDTDIMIGFLEQKDNLAPDVGTHPWSSRYYRGTRPSTSSDLYDLSIESVRAATNTRGLKDRTIRAQSAHVTPASTNSGPYLSSGRKAVRARTASYTHAHGSTRTIDDIDENDEEEEAEEIESAEEQVVDSSVKKGKRTFLDDLDAKYYHATHPKTEEDVNPEFVHIQTLTKGDVFGLHTIVFTDQPSFCVLSNGAECIFINKYFYEKNAPRGLIENLKKEISPYPQSEVIQDELQVAVDWNAYKEILLREVIQKKQQRKMMKFWTGTAVY